MEVTCTGRTDRDAALTRAPCDLRRCARLDTRAAPRAHLHRRRAHGDVAAALPQWRPVDCACQLGAPCVNGCATHHSSPSPLASHCLRAHHVPTCPRITCLHTTCPCNSYCPLPILPLTSCPPPAAVRHCFPPQLAVHHAHLIASSPFITTGPHCAARREIWRHSRRPASAAVVAPVTLLLSRAAFVAAADRRRRLTGFGLHVSYHPTRRSRATRELPPNSPVTGYT